MFGIQTVILKTNPIFGPIRKLEIDKRCTKNVIYLLFKFNEKGQNRNNCSNSYATHTKAAVQFGTLYYKDSFISFRKQQTCQSTLPKSKGTAAWSLSVVWQAGILIMPLIVSLGINPLSQIETQTVERRERKYSNEYSKKKPSLSGSIGVASWSYVNIYCMSKKSWQFLYTDSLYENGQAIHHHFRHTFVPPRPSE